MIQPRTWRGILLVGALAVATFQLARQPDETQLTRPDEPDLRLNYALYDFSGRLLDAEGTIRVDLSAPVLRNDADTGVGTIEAPEFHIREEQDQWYITAESAVISPDREQVDLVGTVHLSRRDAATEQVLEITTSDVLLNVTPRTARTDAPVRIRQRGDWLDAIGMRLDMINETYELLDNVTAHYEIR